MIYLILGAAAIGELLAIAWLIEELYAKQERIKALEHLHDVTHMGYHMPSERRR